MKILCVTHSSRPFVEARCSINALEQRFQPGYLDHLPPLESHPSVDEAISFQGSLSFWYIDQHNHHHLNFLGAYNPDFKIQFADFYKEYLLVCGSDRLEILDPDFKCIKTIRDPWLVGGHTVFTNPEGFAFITSAPANAILVLDIQEAKIVERIPMPEIYGKGYVLTPSDNLHEHFIPTDCQPTHVNCAFPWGENIWVTTLIHGSLGYLDKARNYVELVRGYRGCHGGRVDPQTGDIYLSDSPSGKVIFFDPKTGHITRRYRADTIWLHDTCKIEDSFYAFAVTDKNEIQVIDIDSNEIVSNVDCSLLGQSTMFVNYCEIPSSWKDSFSFFRLHSSATSSEYDSRLGRERIHPFDLRLDPNIEMDNYYTAFSTRSLLQYEYILSTETIFLEPGKYLFDLYIKCKQGSVAGYIYDIYLDQWLCNINLDALNPTQKKTVTITQPTYVKVILTANNPSGPSKVQAEILHLSLKRFQKALSLTSTTNQPKNEQSLDPHYTELLPAITEPDQWNVCSQDLSLFSDSVLISKKDVGMEYLLEGKVITLPKSRLLFEAELECLRGNLAVGLLDIDNDRWITLLYFNGTSPMQQDFLNLDKEMHIKVIVSAHNADVLGPVSAVIKKICLGTLTP